MNSVHPSWMRNGIALPPRNPLAKWVWGMAIALGAFIALGIVGNMLPKRNPPVAQKAIAPEMPSYVAPPYVAPQAEKPSAPQSTNTATSKNNGVANISVEGNNNHVGDNTVIHHHHHYHATNTVLIEKTVYVSVPAPQTQTPIVAKKAIGPCDDIAAEHESRIASWKAMFKR